MPEEKEERAPFSKSSAYNFTKIAIIAIAIFVLLIGTLGSMKWGIFKSFDMPSFIAFVESYQGMFITLTGSIGVGGIAKNWIKAKSEADKEVK